MMSINVFHVTLAAPRELFITVTRLWDDIAFESECRYDDRRPYRLAQVLRMHCVTSTRRCTEYVKPVNLQRDNEKPIKLLVQSFTLLRDQKFVRTSSPEEVNISDVISPVSLTREGDVFRLSLADTTFLEAYFPLDTADDASILQYSREYCSIFYARYSSCSKM